MKCAVCGVFVTVGSVSSLEFNWPPGDSSDPTDKTMAQLYNFTIAQLHNCTTAHIHNVTTEQIHNFTTEQLNNCTTAQLHNCTRQLDPR